MLLLATASTVEGQRAAYPIAWQPAAVVQSVGLGSTVTLQVSFTSKQRLSNVSLIVVPELADVVSVTPSSIATLEAGATASVQLSIRGTAPVGQALSGTLRLQRGSTAAALARPLVITVLTAADSLPPDPGAAGLATLAGIDSDGDGLRDDLQRYLFQQESDSSRRAALIAIAKAFQASLLNATQQDASLNEANRLQKGIECLHFVAPSTAKLAKDALLARVLNTAARTAAYLQFNGQLGGQVFRATPKSLWSQSCSFESGVR